jgi:hypothetical protein
MKRGVESPGVVESDVRGQMRRTGSVLEPVTSWRGALG